VVAMGIDDRRAKRRTSTIPGVPVEGVPTSAEERTSPGVVPAAGPGGSGRGPGGGGGPPRRGRA